MGVSGNKADIPLDNKMTTTIIIIVVIGIICGLVFLVTKKPTVKTLEKVEYDIKPSPTPGQEIFALTAAHKILADEFGCNINDVRKTFFKSIKDHKYSSYSIYGFVTQFENDKEAEAKKYNLKSEYTPAAVLKSLTQEYINLSQDDFYLKRAKELFDQGKTMDETQRIIRNEIKDFPDENKILRDILLKDNPAELLRLKAIDFLYDDNNYHGALKLIDKALALNDPDAEANLLALKDEVNEKMKQADSKA